MKKIVLSAITALMVTVGVYHLALLMGASEPAAFVVAVVAAFAAAFVVAAAFVAAVAAAFAAAAAVVVAFADAVAAAFAAAAFAADARAVSSFVAAVAFATALAVSSFVAAAKQEHIRFRWVVLAYVMEGLAIWGALVVGNPVWSTAIALVGVVVLFALWRAHSRFAALNAPPVASAVPEQNGA